VIDLENGCQPMRFTQGDETFILVYNGELYNTEEIRTDLASEGYTFVGHSDTEVLLKAYMAWGEDCVNRFNGIFAFAIWKEQAQTLFIARDRIGVKPFFYFSRNGVFLFASELKTLLCHPMVEPALDENGVAEIMLLGPGRTPGCGVFQDVQELKAGQCGLLDKDRLRLQTYWSLPTDRTPTHMGKRWKKFGSWLRMPSSGSWYPMYRYAHSCPADWIQASFPLWLTIIFPKEASGFTRFPSLSKTMKNTFRRESFSQTAMKDTSA
jgi:asparagine synthase (glutamine-hydrolysing)